MDRGYRTIYRSLLCTEQLVVFTVVYISFPITLKSFISLPMVNMFPSVFLIAATLLTQGVAATFNLYAYGQSDDVAISGYQIYYKNGLRDFSNISRVLTYNSYKVRHMLRLGMELMMLDLSTVSRSSHWSYCKMKWISAHTCIVSMVDENTTTATYSFQVGSSNTEIDGTKFAINNTAKAYDGVEFIADAADGFITTGFRLYGQTVVYYNTAKGTLESQFYLLSTDTEDLWELRWNVEGTESSSNTTAVPVALRSV